MYFRIRESGEEVSDSQLRHMHPTKSIPAYITADVADFLGADLIVETSAPAVGIGQVAVAGPAVLEDGVYKRSWQVEQSPEEVAAQELANAQEAAWNLIREERNRRMVEGGVPVTVNTEINAEGQPDYLATGKQVWFETSVVDRGRYERLNARAEKLVAAGGSLEDMMSNDEGLIAWKTMDNTWVPLTPEILRDLLDAIENRESALMKQGEAHKAAMLVAADPRSYDYSTGWAQSFAEAVAS